MVRVGEGIEGGVVGKLGRQGRVWSKGGEMVMVGRPGSESLRSGQKNGLDLCMSNNFISMGGVGGGRNRTNCGTMLYA